jgi:alkaline phosphatase D
MKEKTLLIALLLFTILQVSRAHAETQILFASCIKQPDAELWDRVGKLQGDALLLLGDTVYLKQQQLGDKAKTIAAYRATYTAEPFRSLRKQLPVFAIWDDHDFGPDNADSTFSGKKSSLAAFQTFWGQQGAPFDSPGSIAFSTTVENVTLIMTDSRSFRVAAEGKAMFGEAQLQWVRSIVENVRRGVILLASSTPVLTSDISRESLSQYPAERKTLIEILDNAHVPVVVISGDRHYAELSRVSGTKRPLYELTSSPLSASLAYGKLIVPNKYQLGIATGKHNIGRITIAPVAQLNRTTDTTRAKTIDLEILEPDGKQLLHHRWVVSQQ